MRRVVLMTLKVRVDISISSDCRPNQDKTKDAVLKKKLMANMMIATNDQDYFN